MKKIKKIITSPIFSIAAVVLAAGLLIFSSIGGARAALTYFSDDYQAQLEQYDIGVSLLENGERVAWRDYIYENGADGRTGTGNWNETPGEDHMGVLCANLLGEDKELKLGKAYPEVLTIRNSGTINQFARVTIYKYWVDENGKKDQTKNPEYIKLNLTPGSAWIIDESASTPERTVLYYNTLLNAGATASAPFSNTLTIDDAIGTIVDQKVTETHKGDDGYTYTTYKTTYIYDGYQFVLEAHVDAIQEHNAAAAAKSAWGKNVNISGTSLTLQ